MPKHIREGLHFLGLFPKCGWVGAQKSMCAMGGCCSGCIQKLQCIAGPIFVGVKVVGDTFVPAGEESTRGNTTDRTVRNKRLWWKCVIIIVIIIIIVTITITQKGVHKHKHGIKQALGLSILFKYELLLVRHKSNGQVLISKIPSNTCY